MPCVAHSRMSVHKVREKHRDIAHQTVLIMDLTALSIKPNMKMRLNEKCVFFMFSKYKPM